MPTIKQAQRRIGSRVFSGLGEGKGEQVELLTVEAMIQEYIKEFTTKAENNLKKAGAVSSGSLSESIRPETTILPNGIAFKIYVNDYYKFVDEGVKGVGKNNRNTTSPYKFRFLNPSKSHVDAIRKWIRENGIKARVTDVKKYGALGQERKQPKEKDLAYIVARSIKSKGLRRTGFWSDAFDTTFKDFGPKMAEAMGADIRIDLRNMIKEVKK